MRKIYLFILILILIFCTGESAEQIVNVTVSYQPNADKLETVFKASIPLQNGIVYTKVPRGLIVSINESYFFNKGEARIKESSLCILDTIAELLHMLSNYCVIENHTEEFINDANNWELSLSRSSNIAEYMINCGKVQPTQLFSLGYGQYMPFKDNVSAKHSGFDSRVDFVILEYEVKR